MGFRNLRIRTDADLDVAYRWKGADGVPFPLSSLAIHLLYDTPIVLAGTAGADDFWVVYRTAAQLQALALVEGTVEYAVIATRTVDGHTKALVEGSCVVVIP